MTLERRPTIDEDYLARPILFHWFGINAAEFEPWLTALPKRVHPGLVSFWRRTGGGELFETEALLGPLATNESDNVLKVSEFHRKQTEHTTSKSWTITEVPVPRHASCLRIRNMSNSSARPSSGWKIRRTTTHPGEMLREEFLVPLGISQNALAMKIRVPATRIGDIVHGRRSITPETALRLAKFFGNSPQFWLNLQQMYDLSKAQMELGDKIDKEVEARCA